MEFIVTFVYILLFLFIARSIQTTKLNKGRLEYKFFFNGLALKMLGAIIFALVYELHYGYGDTFQYYRIGVSFNEFLLEHPLEWLKLMFSGSNSLLKEKYEIASGYTIYKTVSGEQPFYYESDLFLMGKIISLLCFPSFSFYLTLNIFYGVLSFTGVWKLFQTIIKIYPSYENHLGYAIFYVPSVFFWGSCLMKDSLTLGALGWFFYSVYNIFVNRKRNMVFNMFIFIIATYVLVILKAYILLSFIIALFIWLAVYYNKRIKNVMFRFLFFPLILAIIGFVSIWGILFLASYTDKYQLSQLASTAQGYQSYHNSLEGEDGGGSTYSLGEIDYTPSGILAKAPTAINTTFFRPYLWEVKSFLMIPSAIESLILFCLTFYLLFIKIGFRRFVQLMISNEFIILCFIFSMVLGFSVGFTSYNFGALVRYKIPALVFFTIGLSILYSEYKIRLTKKNRKGRYLMTGR